MDKVWTLELNNPTLGYNPSSAACCEFMNQFLNSPAAASGEQAGQKLLQGGTLTRQRLGNAWGPAWSRHTMPSWVTTFSKESGSQLILHLNRSNNINNLQKHKTYVKTVLYIFFIKKMSGVTSPLTP